MTSQPAPRRSTEPFVGREGEISALDARFEAPSEAAVPVVLVIGEPGIGKTRLMREVARRAGQRGWRVLSGAAYDSEGMPPYLPFIEALQDHIRLCPIDELIAEAGTGAAELALILPELADRLPGTPHRERADPESERYRLFESVTAFLLAVARSAPAGLLLCLDDLHWADQSSLLLLEHLARRSSNTPLVVLATYRDTELEVARPLARTLEQLTRLELSQRLYLKRLDKADVTAILAALGRKGPPPALVEAIYGETEGNPFFVREVFEHLAEEGRLFDTQDAWRSDLLLEETDVPHSVRLVIGRRLAHLSEECRHALAVAAVLGRSFSYELLRMLVGGPEEPLLAAVEEAERARLIASDVRGQVTFAHELIRQTLLGDLSAIRRQQMHRRAAEATERLYGDSLQAHASELAGHYGQAGIDPPTLAKALNYSEIAARQAMAVYAYGEAVRNLEQALLMQAALAPDDKAMRCDLLRALSEALGDAGDPRRVLDQVAPEVLALAEALDDRRRASDACQAAIAALNHLGSGLAWGTPEAARWVELADRFAPEDSLARVWTDIAFGLVMSRAGRRREGRLFVERARSLARRLADPAAIWVADVTFLHAVMAPQFATQARELSQDIATRSRAGAMAMIVRQGLIWRLGHGLISGRREEVELAATEMRALAGQDPQPNNQMMAMLLSGVALVLDGRLEESIEDGARVHTRVIGDLGIAQYGRAVAEWYARPALYLGMEDAIDQMSTSGTLFWTEYVELIHGNPNPAMALLDICTRERERLDPEEDEYSVRDDMVLLEMALLLRHKQAAELLVRRYETWPLVTSGHAGFGPVSVQRLLGEACAMLGRPDDALRQFDRALVEMTAMRFRPEVALVHLGLADLLVRHYPDRRASAFEHLDLAIPELEAMKMQPSLGRALRLRGRRRPPPEPQRRTYEDGLSAREVDVLRLIARGRSNQQIAGELVISLNTVMRHVSNIFTKIEASNRTEAAGYARDHGLL